MNQKACDYCSNLFRPHHSKQLCCSVYCANSRRAKLGSDLKGSCGICQKKITARNKYCSNDCRAIARNQRRTPDELALKGQGKRCNSCLEVKDQSFFGMNKRTRDGFMRQCKECNNKRVNRYNANNKRLLKPKYARHGLTEQEFQTAIKNQDNKCRVCQESLELNSVIDHDHSCCSGVYGCKKCFRGVLCSPCNMVLGILKDDRGALLRAAEYLDSPTLLTSD